jgi:D-beta-D-heptose 7-phosphate kinase / D-beta-D-heptose 1-phosphate adenosyltransferase
MAYSRRMTLARIQHLLSSAADVRVACIGDLMVDRYVYGDVARISPEAPIPVLARQSEAVMLGGVGNVASNVAELGATALLAGVVGDDEAAGEARRLVDGAPRIEGALITVTGRPTTLKTRFVAAGQQLLRVDTEQDGALSEGEAADASAAAVAAVERATVVILSDYAKGAVDSRMARAVTAAARVRGCPVVVDPKGRSFAKYGPVDLIKPNARELAIVTERPVGTDAEVEKALADALDQCEAGAILVTRAGSGMSLAVRGRPVRHFPARAKAVFDVSGAGDTSIAALAVAIAAGAELEEAVAFALLASGVVVGKLGTATVTPHELIAAELDAHRAPVEAKLVSVSEAAEFANRWRAEGLSVGFTNGCFDILHKGHIAYLNQARSWCDRLIVAVNDDQSVRRLKGDSRPVNDLESRAVVLAGLASVDLVTSFAADTPIELIRQIRPDVLVKGADYTIKGVVGAEDVQGWGGVVRLADLVDGYSTTAAIRRMTAGSV